MQALTMVMNGAGLDLDHPCAQCQVNWPTKRHRKFRCQHCIRRRDERNWSQPSPNWWCTIWHQCWPPWPPATMYACRTYRQCIQNCSHNKCWTNTMWMQVFHWIVMNLCRKIARHTITTRITGQPSTFGKITEPSTIDCDRRNCFIVWFWLIQLGTAVV